jgi:hypothetical protein
MKSYFALIIFAWMGISFSSQDAYAYPTYIRLGYGSCIGCHYNPAGGGMLTPYGKGISSTQSLHSTELSEEEEEKLSHAKYLQAFQARILDYKTPQKNRIFPMEAEYLGLINLNKQWKADVSVDIAPRSENVDSKNATKDYQRVYTRVVEINYYQNTNHSYYLGISPLPLGLGLVDHTDFVRANNRLQITDIPINFRAFNFYEKYTFNYFLYLPHYLEGNGNKEKGFGGQYWYLLTKNINFGTQALLGKSDSINRKLAGVLIKAGLKEYSYLGEANYGHRTLNLDSSQFGELTYYNQFTYHPNDWFDIAYAFQGLKKDRDFESLETRHSLMLQSKLLRSFTLMYETRLRHFNSSKEVSHLLQGFFQWW